MDNSAILNSLKRNFALEPQSAKVLVVGLGKTGISVAHYLQKLGFNFAITDSRDKPPLLDEFFQVMPDTPVFTGGFDEAAFKVANPINTRITVIIQKRTITRGSGHPLSSK